MRAMIAPFVLAAGLAAATSPGAAQSVDSLYCQEDQALAVHGATGAALHFDFSMFTPSGQFLGIRGDAAPSGGAWVYTSGMGAADPAEHCAVRLTPVSGGFRIETAENGRCENMGGYGATLFRPLTFPAASRVGPFAPVGMEDPVPPGC